MGLLSCGINVSLHFFILKKFSQCVGKPLEGFKTFEVPRSDFDVKMTSNCWRGDAL